MEPLEVIGHELLRLDEHAFAWVQITTFRYPHDDDRRTLAALIASPGYGHDYASPFKMPLPTFDPPVHGRWRLSAIGVDDFSPTTTDVAINRIRAWADDYEETGPDNPLPKQIAERLERAYDLLRSGAVYTLVNPGEANEHSYGFVTGALGFHEFVVIDRSTQTVHVVVASDD